MTDPRERIANEPMKRMQIVAVAVCVVINLLDGFDALAIAFTAATISNEFGLQPGALGAVFSAGAVGMAIGAFTLAPMGDYIGRRKMILGGLTLIGLGMAFTATVSTLTPLIVLRFITGLGIGAMLASLNTLVAEYSSNKRKNLCISLLHMGYALGGGRRWDGRGAADRSVRLAVGVPVRRRNVPGHASAGLLCDARVRGIPDCAATRERARPGERGSGPATDPDAGSPPRPRGR